MLEYFVYLTMLYESFGLMKIDFEINLGIGLHYGKIWVTGATIIIMQRPVCVCVLIKPLFEVQTNVRQIFSLCGEVLHFEPLI